MSTTVLSTTPTSVASMAAGLPLLHRKVRRAMATWQQAASNAHLAAVMGHTLPLHVSVTKWDPTQTLNDDSSYQDASNRIIASCTDADAVTLLHQATKDHIAWLVGQIRKGFSKECRTTFGCDLRKVAEAEAAEEAAEAKYLRLESKLLQTMSEVEREATDLDSKVGPG